MTDGPPAETRRTALSPRPKGRGKSASLDQNIGRARSARIYWEQGTDDAEDLQKMRKIHYAEIVKKRFNVDSPSFTPSSLAVNGTQAKPKSTGISPKFASAAPFKPKGITSRPGEDLKSLSAPN
ncbi:MAG: hypothetical protein Q9201_001318 [Fulgogasparrea decipioides]